MKKIVFIWALFFLFIGSGEFLYASDVAWRDSFDRICAHTADAGKLSREELSGLIVETDELLKVIISSDDPRKKVYLIRLKKCRNFFIFMESIAEDKSDK